MTTKTRAQTQKLYAQMVVTEVSEVVSRQVKEAVDAGYCEGYNTVLEAAEECLPFAEYQKLLDYLQSVGR